VVIDDTSTVPSGDFQIVASVDLIKFRNDHTLSLPVNVTYGLLTWLDLGIDSGYQFASFHEDNARRRMDGFLDTTLAVKARFLHLHQHELSLAVAGGVKLPTASQEKGLGSGHVDLDLLLIATRTWTKNSLDANFGFTFTRSFAGQGDSHVFLYGVAWRHRLTDSLELFSEIYAESPHDDWDETLLLVRGGWQLAFTENILWGTGLGTGLRRGNPDLTATTGITWTF
jgi:hypothetical protein